MQNTLTIARREFKSYFNSPSAYIVGVLFLLVVGFFFWSGFFLDGRASVRRMFDLAFLVSVFVAPAITMGLVAEERRNGTLELLITMPVRDGEVIIGKYLGAVGLYVVLLALTLPQVITVSTLGELDWGPVWSGYLGLLLSGASYIALGLLASSFSTNQLVALVAGLGLCFVFWIIGNLLALLPPSLASVLEWFSFDYHVESLSRGVIDSRNLLYFASIITVSLGFAFRSLESRRWK